MQIQHPANLRAIAVQDKSFAVERDVPERRVGDRKRWVGNRLVEGVETSRLLAVRVIKKRLLILKSESLSIFVRIHLIIVQ
jgi:hypothetical protein